MMFHYAYKSVHLDEKIINNFNLFVTEMQFDSTVEY